MSGRFRLFPIAIIVAAGLSVPAHAQSELFEGFEQASLAQKQEAAAFKECCATSVYVDHYDCGCVAQLFLKARIGLGDEVAPSSVEIAMQGPDLLACVDPERAYQTGVASCQIGGVMVFRGPPPEAYCDCFGNKYAAVVQTDLEAGISRRGRERNATRAYDACRE